MLILCFCLILVAVGLVGAVVYYMMQVQSHVGVNPKFVFPLLILAS